MDKPKQQTQSPQAPQKDLAKVLQETYTMEATAFLSGLFREFQQQVQKYKQLTAQLLTVEAQIELAEKTLCLTRDHLAMQIEKSEGASPNDWQTVLNKVRFAGVRLADACRTLLLENERLTPEELLHGLNAGMFRFRTNSPLREIHAALMRQPVKKEEGQYVWIGKLGQQMPLRMRVVDTTDVIDVPPAATAQGGNK